MMVGKNRRILGLFLACTVVGWFGMVAAPAGAHTPPDNNANFNPDEFNGDGQNGYLGQANPSHGPDTTGGVVKEGEVMSDANEGFDTSYELRAVADIQTTFYEWYDCLDGGNPALAAAAPGCAPIATDTTPDPAATPPGEGSAHAFSGSYNIPTTSEGATMTSVIRDVWGIACANDAIKGGPPYDTSHCIPSDTAPPTGAGGFEPSGGTTACTGVAVNATCINDVHMDDAQTTTEHAATSSGRIHMLVTTSRTYTHPDVHGASLKNGEDLTVIAFTGPTGVDAVQICLDQSSDDEQHNDVLPTGGGVAARGGCTHSGTDTTNTPGGGSACHAAAPTAPGGDCWAVTIGVPNANNVFGVSLIEYEDNNPVEGTTAGTGDCAGANAPIPAVGAGAGDDCQLDKIYVTTTLAGTDPTFVPTPPPAPPPVPLPPTPPANPCPAGLKALRGTSGNDKIRGTSGCDKIRGRGGDDNIRAKAGDDVLNGGPGDDVLNGGSGNDKCIIKRSDQDKVKGCEEIVRKR